MLKIILAISLLAVMSFSDDINDGLDAYNKKDYSTALQVWQKACDNGTATGCHNLGFMYAKGEGVEKNIEIAVTLYRKACDNNFSRSCFFVGAYEYDKKNFDDAFTPFKKACEVDVLESCIMTGAMYETGLGTKQDFSKAFDDYNKACAGGSAKGCNAIASLYENGFGVKRDLNKAKEFYSSACESNITTACNRLKMISNPAYTNDVKVFGITIGKTKASEVKKITKCNFSEIEDGLFQSEEGCMPKVAGLSNIKYGVEDGIVIAVIANFKSSYKDEILKLLNAKYGTGTSLKNNQTVISMINQLDDSSYTSLPYLIWQTNEKTFISLDDKDYYGIEVTYASKEYSIKAFKELLDYSKERKDALKDNL